MKFKIEKNIPLPDAWPGFVHALRRMDMGDSFFVEDPGLCTPSTIYSLARRENIRVSVRQIEGGVRVWRVPERQHLNTKDVPDIARAKKDLNFRMRTNGKHIPINSEKSMLTVHPAPDASPPRVPSPGGTFVISYQNSGA